MSEEQKAPITVTIEDPKVLRAAYIAFVKQGGLFVPTKREFEAGQSLSFIINLPKDPRKYPVVGQIIWVTPNNAQGNRTPGVGIQFEGEQGKILRKKIESILGPSLKSDEPTHTM